MNSKSITITLNENNSEILLKSKKRIEEIDSKRKWIDNTEGRIGPNIESMLMGEAKKFDLAVLHIDINNFKELTSNLNNEQYRSSVSIF